MYWLVLLRRGGRTASDRVTEEHETFIDGLIRTNQVLLGGVLRPRNDLPAAYLLSCETREGAEKLVASDPYVKAGVYRPRLLAWELVAINPEAIEEDLVLRPGDV